jgi:START domain
MFQRFRLVLIALVALFASPAFVGASGPNWQPVKDEDGIKVWSLEIPGRDLPGFRGITTIDASLDEILKAMYDIPAHTEWMWKMREARVVKQLSESHGIIYYRVRAPWPIKDRDMVVDVDYRFTPQHNALTIRFKQTHEEKVEVPFWTVRTKRLEGFYRLWIDEAGKTQVLYQVEVDIGGNVPDFSARNYARKLPFFTLQRLRERVESQRAATP